MLAGGQKNTLHPTQTLPHAEVWDKAPEHPAQAGKGAHYKNPPHKHRTQQNSGAEHQQHHALSRERCTRFDNYQNPHTNTADKQKCGTRHQNTLHLAGTGAHSSITTTTPHKHC